MKAENLGMGDKVSQSIVLKWPEAKFSLVQMNNTVQW